MLKVYEYLDLIPDVIFDCDCIYSEYKEIEAAYKNTVISELSPQLLIDLVEEAIRCADKKAKAATVKRLRRRIADRITSFNSFRAQIDFSENEDGSKSVYSFMAEISDNLQAFDSLLNILCEDYCIGVEDEKVQLRLTAWESALCWYYQHGSFITSKDEVGKAIKLYHEYLDEPNIKIDSYQRKCRDLRTRTDIVGASTGEKSKKHASFGKAIRFLKLQKLPTEQAEADMVTYSENVKANKSKL